MTGTFNIALCCAHVVSYVTVCHFIHFPLLWQYQWPLQFPVFTESSCFFVFVFQTMSHEYLLTMAAIDSGIGYIHWLYSAVPLILCMKQLHS